MITRLLKKIHIWLELASIVYRDNLLVQRILIIVQLHYSTESSCTQTSPLLQSVVSPVHQSSRTSSPHRIRKLVIDSGRWMLQTSKTSLIAWCDPSQLKCWRTTSKNLRNSNNVTLRVNSLNYFLLQEYVLGYHQRCVRISPVMHKLSCYWRLMFHAVGLHVIFVGKWVSTEGQGWRVFDDKF